MTNQGRNNDRTGNSRDSGRGLFYFAGCRYWTASLLPALVGTTLPFWLRPPGFSFRWLGAIEFLIAIVLVHAGFSFLQARFENRSTASWPKSRLLGTSGVYIVAGCLLGLHLNSALPLHHGVPGGIFLTYGICALFAGVLYVVPPFSFRGRVGGEVVLAVGLGLVPVLGAYLVQVGDITRRVYLAALPLVIATGLWVWIEKLISRTNDEKDERRSIVMLFTPQFSGRYITLVLTVLLYASVLMTVFTRSSLHPLSLIALLSVVPGLRIVAISWNNYGDQTKMLEVSRYAFLIHLLVGIVISASSLTALVH